MDVALRVAVPVGIVPWRTRSDTFSAVVKVTYDLGASDWRGLAAEQESLTSGETADDGLALYPDDFVEGKPACDVVVVGPGLVGDLGPMRIRVGPLDRFAPRAALLGPLNEPAPDGACAAPQQRVPAPSFPLEISLEGAGRTLRAVLPGPVPEAGLVLARSWRAMEPVALVADTLLLDPLRGRCAVLFRGAFQLRGGHTADATLVVDATARLGASGPGEIARWPRAPIVLPTDDRVSDDELEITHDGARVAAASHGFQIRPPLDTLDLDALDPSGTSPFVGVSPAAALMPFWVSPDSKHAAAASRPGRTSDLPFSVPDSGDDVPLSQRPLMVIGNQGTPLAYPPVPLRSSSRPPPSEPTALRTLGTGTLPPPPSRPSNSPNADEEELAVTGTGTPPPPAPQETIEFDGPDEDDEDALETIPPPRQSFTAELAIPAATPARTLPPPPPAPSAPVPFAGRELPSYERRAMAAHVPIAEEKALARTARLDPPPPSERRVEGLTLAEYAALRGELWAGRPRRDVLRARGLTELRWRVAERRWAEEIDVLSRDPDEAGRLVAAMRATTLRRAD